MTPPSISWFSSTPAEIGLIDKEKILFYVLKIKWKIMVFHFRLKQTKYQFQIWKGKWFVFNRTKFSKWQFGNFQKDNLEIFKVTIWKFSKWHFGNFQSVNLEILKVTIWKFSKWQFRNLPKRLFTFSKLLSFRNFLNFPKQFFWIKKEVSLITIDISYLNKENKSFFKT